MAVELPTMQGRSYLAAFSLPSRQLYVMHGSGRRRYTSDMATSHVKAVELDYVILRERVIGGCAHVTVNSGASVTQIIIFCVVVREWHEGVSRREQE